MFSHSLSRFLILWAPIHLHIYPTSFVLLTCSYIKKKVMRYKNKLIYNFGRNTTSHFHLPNIPIRTILSSEFSLAWILEFRLPQLYKISSHIVSYLNTFLSFFFFFFVLSTFFYFFYYTNARAHRQRPQDNILSQHHF